MQSRVVDVSAPSRLHFGMFSFGQPGVRQFGGVGAMIDSPRLQLRLWRAEQLTIEAPDDFVSRIRTCVERCAESWNLASLPSCRIELLAAPRQHVGLGSGTQLAMSVAAGLDRLFEFPRYLDAAAVARRAGRGLRSEIGMYGFQHGGLLVEAGKLPGDEQSALVARVKLPPQWRFVLLCPAGREAVSLRESSPGHITRSVMATLTYTSGLHGENERRAFERLPPVPLSETDQLCREVLMNLLPAAELARFDDFSESLFRFGHLAGLCFATEQAGAFASPQSQRLVELLQSQGIRGVGQSSWGPTLFALIPDEPSARSLVEWLQNRPEASDLECIISAPALTGATVEVRNV